MKFVGNIYYKWFIEFYDTLALEIVCKQTVKFSQRSVFEEGKNMNNFNKEN